MHASSKHANVVPGRSGDVQLFINVVGRSELVGRVTCSGRIKTIYKDETWSITHARMAQNMACHFHSVNGKLLPGV